jgi:hypothetical protein
MPKEPFNDTGGADHKGVVGCCTVGDFGCAPDAGDAEPDRRIFRRQQQYLDKPVCGRDKDANFFCTIDMRKQ